MSSLEQAVKTMVVNLQKNTGKSLEQWIEIVKLNNLAKHSEIITFLKDEHSLSYGFANLVAHKSKSSDAGSAADTSELIEKQYKGKQHFRPVYEKLMAEILRFGTDIEVSPKNAYVSLRRKKQFALLQPATKTRFEIGLILKSQEAKGVLEVIRTANAMCSHKISIEKESDISTEVLDWLKVAYETAG
jgi:predicted transport protein